MNQIGVAIEGTRKALRLTQQQLADLAGISYRPIYLIENGRSIRLETLLRICDALGLKLTITPKRGMAGD